MNITFYAYYSWISDRNRNTNKQAYLHIALLFYIIKIAKLYVISLLILVSISIGNPPIGNNKQHALYITIQFFKNHNCKKVESQRPTNKFK